jgi:CubicO group peptidase (beta-lactamase class C family)
VPDRDSVKTANVAGRHGRRGPPVTGLGPLTKVFIDDPTSTTAAAGGINTSASDIIHWLRVQLDHGKLPDGSRIWSEKQAAELWAPQTIMSSGDGATPDDPTAPVTSTYALGWIVRDYRGERILRHSGGLHGQVTQTAMLPARGLGVAVLTNVEGYEAGGLINAVIDLLIGAPAFDWLESTKSRTAKRQQDALKAMGAEPDQPPAGALSLPLARYAGRYRDAWYGDVVIKRDGDGLAIEFVPTPAFRCRLEAWGADSFRTHLPKDAGEDAVLHFSVDNGRVTGLTMKALSPIADFSYDFHHLWFKPVGGV